MTTDICEGCPCVVFDPKIGKPCVAEIAALRAECERLRKLFGDHECRCPVCGYKAPCAKKCGVLSEPDKGEEG